MEGELGSGLVLLAFLFFGRGRLFSWRRFRRDKAQSIRRGLTPATTRPVSRGECFHGVSVPYSQKGPA